MNWQQFEWISFDCYGTLIDWESGILGYMRPLLHAKNCSASDSQILNLYSELEPREQSKPYRSYREVLAAVMHGFAANRDFDLSAKEAAGLADSIARWKPFPDTVQGLRQLKSQYKLAILSNIDDDLFALTAKHLDVAFDLVVTAQQARSYKPSRHNFEVLLERLGRPKEKLLHAAESLYHDVAPARALGIATAWVNRRQGKPASATRLADAKPSAEVSSVAELARLTTEPAATDSRES
jgi:2-haloacid dehalogenase